MLATVVSTIFFATALVAAADRATPNIYIPLDQPIAFYCNAGTAGTGDCEKTPNTNTFCCSVEPTAEYVTHRNVTAFSASPENSIECVYGGVVGLVSCAHP